MPLMQWEPWVELYGLAGGTESCYVRRPLWVESLLIEYSFRYIPALNTFCFISYSTLYLGTRRKRVLVFFFRLCSIIIDFHH